MSFIRNKEGYMIDINREIFQEGIIIINVCIFSNKGVEYMKIEIKMKR